ncbi:RNA polymerase II degradation factor 1-like, partial [Cyclospora cayetanensis]|uniref:RNA polymerase II degradation factor 1-like n=1 Tax=Cyclospora cayetanensis TaxID=88456 RepID=A0A6P6RR44_9EIME
AESTGPGGASLSGELMEGEAEADDDEVSAVSSQLSSTVRSVGSYSRSVTSSVLQPSRGSAANSYYDSYVPFSPTPSAASAAAAAAWQQQQGSSIAGGSSAKRKALVRLPVRPTSAAAATGLGRPAGGSKKQAYMPSYLGYVPQGIEIPLRTSNKSLPMLTGSQQELMQQQQQPLQPQSKKQRRAAVREAEAASAVAAYPFASVAPSGPPSLGSSAIQTAPGVYQDADPAACGFSQSQQPPTPFGGASSSLSGVAMWPPLMQQQFPATPQGVVSLGAEGLSHEKKGKRDRKGKAGKAKKKERDSSPSFHPAQQQMDYMPAPAAPQIVEGTPQRPQGMKPLRIRLSFGAQQQQQPVSAAVPHQLPMQQTQPVYTYPEPHDPQQPTQQQPMQQQPVQQHSFYAQPPYPPVQLTAYNPQQQQQQQQQQAATAVPPKFRIRLPMQPPQ